MRGIVALAAVIIASFVMGAFAQTPQTSVTLQRFFEVLPGRLSAGTPPDDQELQEMHSRVIASPSGELQNAVPIIAAGLSNKDENVQSHSAFALFLISRRPDGPALLQGHIGAIAGALSSASDRVRRSAGMALINARVDPSHKALSQVITFIDRVDPDPQDQVVALATVLRIAPQRAEVISATERFIYRGLDADTRVAVLAAVGQSQASDAKIVQAVTASLSDADARVKVMAISVLSRMGADALREAEPVMRVMLQRAEEPADVKAAISQALERRQK